MPIPEGCRGAEARFQEVLTTFRLPKPGQPGYVACKNGSDDWRQDQNELSVLIQNRLQQAHQVRILHYRQDDPFWMDYNNRLENPSILNIVNSYVQSHTYYNWQFHGPDHPIAHIITDYATRVQAAETDVITCLRNPPAAAPLPSKRLKRSDVGWDDPITARRIKTGDKVIRLDGRDTMVFSADDPDGITKWFMTANTNPMTNIPPTSREEFIIDIDEDNGAPPPEEGGRRRKTRKSKRRARTTRVLGTRKSRRRYT